MEIGKGGRGGFEKEGESGIGKGKEIYQDVFGEKLFVFRL